MNAPLASVVEVPRAAPLVPSLFIVKSLTVAPPTRPFATTPVNELPLEPPLPPLPLEPPPPPLPQANHRNPAPVPKINSHLDPRACSIRSSPSRSYALLASLDVRQASIFISSHGILIASIGR